MALTGMQIYKSLPKTNCKDCGLPTCMAFAMQVAAKQRALEDCPHVSDEATSSLAESTAPPMKLVKIGSEERKVEIGQETVMFRHEDKLHRSTGVAVRFDASLSDAEVDAKLKAVGADVFVRVGERIFVKFCAVEVDGVDDPAGRMKKIVDTSCLAPIVMGSDAAKVKAAAEAVKAERPLIYRAEAANADAMIAVAKDLGLPLAIHAPSLEELADLSQKAKDAGVEDLVLSFDCDNLGNTIRTLTTARRAALKKQFRPLGYPSMATINTGNPELDTVFAASCAAKYCGIVIVDGAEPNQVLPILTIVQDVYTDPQVPNTVETKLYEIGGPGENSPVLFTTNFSLTYFSVEGEVERSKVPTYICVVDTEGLGVLNAYAGDKISAEKVVKTLKEQGVADKVKHRKLIIPGLLPIFRAEIEDTSEWTEVIIGPENAREIPAFLASNFG